MEKRIDSCKLFSDFLVHGAHIFTHIKSVHAMKNKANKLRTIINHEE